MPTASLDSAVALIALGVILDLVVVVMGNVYFGALRIIRAVFTGGRL